MSHYSSCKTHFVWYAYKFSPSSPFICFHSAQNTLRVDVWYNISKSNTTLSCPGLKRNANVTVSRQYRNLKQNGNVAGRNNKTIIKDNNSNDDIIFN